MTLMANKANLYGDGETSDDVQREGLGGKTRTKSAPGKADPLVGRYWREVERYERAASDWHQDGDEIIQTYLDENRSASSSARKFALLWANVETLKPAVYAKVPALVCSRRFKDRDPIGKVCAELMERATNTTFDLHNTDEVFRMVRDDRLLPGRGQAWVRYEATIEQYDDPDGTPDEKTGEIPQRERLKSEKVCADHVPWDEFGHNVSRTWAEVWLVWRVVYKTREECEDRFGKVAAKTLAYSAKSPGSGQGAGSSKDDPDDRCKIYELWDKRRGLTSWIAKGETTFLDSGPPPLDFREFFPCPEPCFSTKSSKSLIPRPDYRYYSDQAKEINDLTEKIGRMTEWLIVKGFIPNSPSSLADPIQEALEDKSNRELFVPVESHQEWTERGGSAKLIDWLPIDKIVQALQAAIQARNQLIQDVFQVTGISDILRGQTDPDETLGAQELKAQTGTRRLRNTKDELARFCRDIGRLVAEVIAEKFEPSSIAAITGYKYVPQAMTQMMGAMQQPADNPQMPAPGPMAQMQMPMMGHNQGPSFEDDADPDLVFDERHMQLLRDDKMRNFRVDIETDSTVQADENAEKASRVEYATMVTTALEKAAQLMMAPQAAPLMPVMQEMLMYVTRGFRAGRGMEDTLERSFKKLEAAMQQASKQPPPQVIEAQQKMQLAQQELAADHQLAQQENAGEMQMEAQKQQGHMQLEVRKQNLDAAIKSRQITQTAHAQAQDRIAKAMLDLKPAAPGSGTRH